MITLIFKKMQLRLLIVWSLLFWIVPVAQSKGFIFEATLVNGNPLTLFGSVHSANDLTDELIPLYGQTVKKCKRLYMETELDTTITHFADIEQYRSGALLDADSIDWLLHYLLSQKNYNLKSFINRNHLQNLPIYSAYIMGTSFIPVTGLKQGRASLDEALSRSALQKKISIHPAENFANAFKSMRTISIDVVRNHFVHLKSFYTDQYRLNKYSELQKMMIQSFLRGDIHDTRSKYIEASALATVNGADTKFIHNLYFARDPYLLEILFREANQYPDSCFVYGAAHLGGEDGLINLLIDSGADVWQLIDGQRIKMTRYSPK